MNARFTRSALATAGIVVGAAGAYSRWFVPWERGWGATAAEREMPLAGDEFVDAPQYLTTRAITMDASPEDLFPWLVQMGEGRGGLYSYDALDQLFGFLDRPSSTEILEEWQHLQVGDEIPLGRGANFPVAALEPNRWLVLAGGADGMAWSWAMVLEPTADGRLRFITRNRVSGVGSRFALAMVDLAAFIMVRRWLQVLKGRAEMTALARRAPEADTEDRVAEPVLLGMRQHR